jgi:hypothetical protein
VKNGNGNGKEPLTRERLAELLDDTVAVTRAMDAGIREAMIRHKRLGEQIAVWDYENNCVKIIQPEDIPEDGYESEIPEALLQRQEIGTGG